ncbi:MAG: glycosyltransferase [Clostridiales bacterium]|nr:glycosyltransferase [Clostridiales bacterium]
MKRVLILNPYLATLGGGEKQMAHLCRFIECYCNHQVQIEIVAFSDGTADEPGKNAVTMDTIMEKFNVRLRCTSIRKVEFSSQRSTMRIIKNLLTIGNMTRQYDVFINSMYFSKHIGRAKKNLYICMFPPKKFLWDPNDRFKCAAEKVLNVLFFHSYDLFLPISAFSNRWMETYWKKSRKYEIVYPPVFSEDSVVGQYDENEKKNIIISVGRFFVGGHCKKQLEMVQCFLDHEGVLGDYEYHLAGSVFQNEEKDVLYLSQVREIAQKSNRIFIHENCSFEALISLYKQAKIFWHATGYGVDENAEPDQMEHFGITTVEAMSYGVVPVVINQGGQQEIVDEEKDGFLWCDEGEWIQKTVQVIQNEQKRKEMAVQAVEKAKRFSEEAFDQRYTKVFDGLRI